MRGATYLCNGVRPIFSLLTLMSSGFAFCERITDARGVGPGPNCGTGYGARIAGPDIDIRPLWVFFAVEGMGMLEPPRPLPSRSEGGCITERRRRSCIMSGEAKGWVGRGGRLGGGCASALASGLLTVRFNDARTRKRVERRITCKEAPIFPRSAIDSDLCRYSPLASARHVLYSPAVRRRDYSHSSQGPRRCLVRSPVSAVQSARTMIEGHEATSARCPIRKRSSSIPILASALLLRSSNV